MKVIWMFENSFASAVAMAAHRALIYEVLTAPKPGLVDRFGSGAHEDMDVFSFVDSAGAILPYLYHCAKTGQEFKAEPANLLKKLRPAGLEAEKAMLEATGGVNTHKGAVFSMGLICAAAGVCGETASAEDICIMAGRIAAPATEDFAASDAAPETAGERLHASAGLCGVRGEAAAGFPSIRETALPAMREALKAGKSINDAAVLSLAKLILRAEDTTFIKRCAGRDPRPYLESVEKALTAENPIEALAETDRLWSAAGLSAGGCADLLALTLFLHFFCNAKKTDRYGSYAKGQYNKTRKHP